MEDVWKDLSLSSSFKKPSAAGAHQEPINEMEIQEFLARPSNQINHGPQSDGRRNDNYNIIASVGPAGEGNASERKRRRLMKNRESAVRSRARKRAYTYELELEIENLIKENAMLKQQQEKVCVDDDDDDEHPKRHKLHRTLSL